MKLLIRIMQRIKKPIAAGIICTILAIATVFVLHQNVAKNYRAEATVLLQQSLSRQALFPSDEFSNVSLWSREGYRYLNTLFDDDYLQALIMKHPQFHQDMQMFFGRKDLDDDAIAYYVDTVFKRKFKISYLGSDSGTFHMTFTSRHRELVKTVVIDAIDHFKTLASQSHQRSLERSILVLNNLIRDRQKEVLVFEKEMGTTNLETLQKKLKTLRNEIVNIEDKRLNLTLLRHLLKSDAVTKLSVIKKPYTPLFPYFPTKRMSAAVALVLALIFMILWQVIRSVWHRLAEDLNGSA